MQDRRLQRDRVVSALDSQSGGLVFEFDPVLATC